MIARVLHPILILAVALLLNYPSSAFAFPLDESFPGPHPVPLSRSWPRHVARRERGGNHRYPHQKRTSTSTTPARFAGVPALVPSQSPKLPSWVNALLDEQSTTPSVTVQLPLASSGPSNGHLSSWPIDHHEAGMSVQRPGNPLLNQQQNPPPVRKETPILDSSPNKRPRTQFEDPTTRRARMTLGKAQGQKSRLGRPNPLPAHNVEKRSPAGLPPSSAPAASWMDKYALGIEELNPHAPRRPKSPPPMSIGRQPPSTSSGAGPSTNPVDPSSKDPAGPSTPRPPRPGSTSLVFGPPPRIPTPPRRVPGARAHSPPRSTSPVSASAPTWGHNFHAKNIAELSAEVDTDPSRSRRPRAGAMARPPSIPRLKSSHNLAALAEQPADEAGPSSPYDPGAGPSSGAGPPRLPKARSRHNLRSPAAGQLPPLHPAAPPLRLPMGRRPRARKTPPPPPPPPGADARVLGFEGSLGELDLLMARASLQEGRRGRRGGGRGPGGLTRELGRGRGQGDLGRGRGREGALEGGQTGMGAGAGGGGGEGLTGGARGAGPGWGQTGPQSPSKRMREEGEDAEGGAEMSGPKRVVSPKGLGITSPRGR